MFDSLVANPVLLAFPPLVLWGAWRDFRAYDIPNRISVILVALWPLAVLVGGWSGADVLSGLGAGLILFVAGFGLWLVNAFGGGDVKLNAAVGLWLGLKALPTYLLAMTLLGGVLALILLGLRRFDWSEEQVRRFPVLDRAEGIPYGIAIAVAALVLMPVLLAH